MSGDLKEAKYVDPKIWADALSKLLLKKPKGVIHNDA